MLNDALIKQARVKREEEEAKKAEGKAFDVWYEQRYQALCSDDEHRVRENLHQMPSTATIEDRIELLYSFYSSEYVWCWRVCTIMFDPTWFVFTDAHEWLALWVLWYIRYEHGWFNHFGLCPDQKQDVNRIGSRLVREVFHRLDESFDDVCDELDASESEIWQYLVNRDRNIRHRHGREVSVAFLHEREKWEKEIVEQARATLATSLYPVYPPGIPYKPANRMGPLQRKTAQRVESLPAALQQLVLSFLPEGPTCHDGTPMDESE